MGGLFGTDGVRGLAGQPPLDPATIWELGRALVSLGKRHIVIGRDTRASGVWIEGVLQAAIVSGGGRVTLAEVITTPGVAFLCRSMPFDAGIVISASHNPYPDNGIKIFSGQGTKLSDREEGEIERALSGDGGGWPGTDLREPSREKVATVNPECSERYLEFLLKSCPKGGLTGLKIVMDCAHGAAFHVAPTVFRRLGAEVIPLNVAPDGVNINSGCGSLHPQEMMERVRKEEASFGVAFDGDSDRAIFCDDRGKLRDGDHTLYVLARHLAGKGQLSSGGVVGTVMSNMGLELALQREALRLIRTRVGDRYVLEEMVRGGHGLGGEPSGHVIIAPLCLAGDGILTALTLARIVTETGDSLAQLARGLETLPQLLLNVPVAEKQEYSCIPEIQSRIDAARRDLSGRGRVLVRYSGTESLVRIMLEGPEQSELEKHGGCIAEEFRKRLG